MASQRRRSVQEPADGRFAGLAQGAADLPNFTLYGSQCRVFEDLDTAAFFDAGSHLLPWVGDPEVFVDRYDAILLLDGPIRPLTHRPNEPDGVDPASTAEELDWERFADLWRSEQQHNAEDFELTPAAGTRAGSSSADVVSGTAASTAAVGYSYHAESEHPGPSLDQDQQSAQRLVAATVSEEEFRPWFEVPQSLQRSLPPTMRMHKIIASTAKFVRETGGQIEIVLRVKQANNPNMQFLLPANQFHGYFRWLVDSQTQDELMQPPEQQAGQLLVGASSGTGEAAQEALGLIASYGSQASDGSEPPAPLSAQLPAERASDANAHPAAQATASETIEPSAVPEADQTTSQTLQSPEGALPTSDADLPVPASSATPGPGAAEPSAPPLSAAIGLANPRISSPAPHSLLQVGAAASSQPGKAESSMHSAIAELPAPGAAAAGSEQGLPPDTRAIIDRLAAFIQKHGLQFEAKVRKKESSNPSFAFLLPWHPHHHHYRTRLQEVLGKDVAAQLTASMASQAEERPASPGAPASSKPAAEQGVTKSDAAGPSATVAAQHVVVAEPLSGMTQPVKLAIRPGPSAAQRAQPLREFGDGHEDGAPEAADADALAAAIPKTSASQRQASATTPSAPSAVPMPAIDAHTPRQQPLNSVSSSAAELSSAAPRAHVQANPAIATLTKVAAQPHTQAAIPLHRPAAEAKLGQPGVDAGPLTADERQAQRRRLAKELLAARQRAAAAEEEKQRQAQASAIANHRQIFLDQDNDDPAGEDNLVASSARLAPLQAAPALPKLEEILRPRRVERSPSPSSSSSSSSSSNSSSASSGRAGHRAHQHHNRHQNHSLRREVSSRDRQHHSSSHRPHRVRESSPGRRRTRPRSPAREREHRKQRRLS